MQKNEVIDGGKKVPTSRFGRYVLNPISRLLHGNTAGYINNVVAQRQLRRFQLKSKDSLKEFQYNARTRAG